MLYKDSLCKPHKQKQQLQRQSLRLLTKKRLRTELEDWNFSLITPCMLYNNKTVRVKNLYVRCDSTGKGFLSFVMKNSLFRFFIQAEKTNTQAVGGSCSLSNQFTLIYFLSY